MPSRKSAKHVRNLWRPRNQGKHMNLEVKHCPNRHCLCELWYGNPCSRLERRRQAHLNDFAKINRGKNMISGARRADSTVRAWAEGRGHRPPRDGRPIPRADALCRPPEQIFRGPSRTCALSWSNRSIARWPGPGAVRSFQLRLETLEIFSQKKRKILNFPPFFWLHFRLLGSWSNCFVVFTIMGKWRGAFEAGHIIEVDISCSWAKSP